MEWEESLNEAEKAARMAGEMLRRNIDSSREIAYKGAVNLVTDFDRRSQEIIFSHLSSCFPDHDVLAEEDLCEERGSVFRWIIDPIDGTTNYAHNFPIFCVSIALEWKSKVVCGVIYDPMRDEMFAAISGKGAVMNGRKIHTSINGDLDKSLLATGFPYDVRESEVNNIDHFANFATRVQAIRRCGSAALDLSYVACGRFDGFWELKLNPWDVAAGVLIVVESGGRVTDFKGESTSIYGKDLCASNGLIHEQMIRILKLGKQL
ncbi:MAG: inositol monophosphatase family protein [Candidatus Aminicenantes bacterium]|jgi:myo-inositol-1(or 4)-monophosphatase